MLSDFRKNPPTFFFKALKLRLLIPLEEKHVDEDEYGAMLE